MNEKVFDLKGEMTLLNVLLLYTTDSEAICSALLEQRDKAHQFLARSPVIVDCQHITEQPDELDFVSLKQQVIASGLVPAGIRNIPPEIEAKAHEAGWALLRPGRTNTRAAPDTDKQKGSEDAENEKSEKTEAAVTESDTEHEQPAETDAEQSNEPIDAGNAPAHRLQVVERPVRSGQQVYCPDGDIVVLQQTSAGSELLAGGSVHVYGALRGRVLAGVQGDKNARIFCQQLEAELVSIAGRYRLLDEGEADLKGQAVMIYLDDEKLKIVPV